MKHRSQFAIGQNADKLLPKRICSHYDGILALERKRVPAWACHPTARGIPFSPDPLNLVVEKLMNRRVGITFGAAFLSLGLWSLTAHSAGEEEKEAQKAVLKLMESMEGKKGDVKAQIAAIKKKFDELKPIMYVYKPKAKGGIGMKDGAGIEQELAKIGSKNSKLRLTKEKIASLKDDLVKAGRITITIAEITDEYAPKKDTAEWKKYTKDMKKAGEELIEAAKSGEAAKIKTAANNLSASCTDCHSKFRND